MKKIYMFLGLLLAFSVMTGVASAATIESPWYTSRQNVDSTYKLVGTYKGNPIAPFTLWGFDPTKKVVDLHKFVMPFLKGQGISVNIDSLPNTTNHTYKFWTITHDAGGREVTDIYNLPLFKNFDTAYITLTGTPSDIAEVLFLVMEVRNADGSVALQQFGTYFDTTQTGFAQMVIKARNLSQGQTLSLSPVFKGVTIPQERTLRDVNVQIDLYSSN